MLKLIRCKMYSERLYSLAAKCTEIGSIDVAFIIYSKVNQDNSRAVENENKHF
jgi:hypothetical protein